MKKFGGKVMFLDRDNINTDEIIPAKYLTEIEKEPLKEHLLEDLEDEGLDPTQVNWEEYGAIVSKSNFGCGSSREMAAWAFEINGINVIVASNFARIFRENAFNCGMLAISLSEEEIEQLFQTFSAKPNVSLDVDLESQTLTFSSDGVKQQQSFKINQFEKDLVLAGGWVELADQKY